MKKCPNCNGTTGYLLKTRVVAEFASKWDGECFSRETLTQTDNKTGTCLDCEKRIKIED